MVILKGWVYGGCRSRCGDEEQSDVHSQLWGGAVMSSGGFERGVCRGKGRYRGKGWCMDGKLFSLSYIRHTRLRNLPVRAVGVMAFSLVMTSKSW